MLKTLNIEFLHEHRERLGVQSLATLCGCNSFVRVLCFWSKNILLFFISWRETKVWLSNQRWSLLLIQKVVCTCCSFPLQLKSVIPVPKSRRKKAQLHWEQTSVFVVFERLKHLGFFWFLVTVQVFFFSSKPEVTYMYTIFFLFDLFLVLAS